MLFPVWHGKGQEVNKLKSYAVNQLKVTQNTFRDPIIAAVTVSMIAVLLIFVVWPLLEVVKQSLVDTAGNYSFQAYKIFYDAGNIQGFLQHHYAGRYCRRFGDGDRVPFCLLHVPPADPREKNI